jgi:hypothetical protein
MYYNDKINGKGMFQSISGNNYNGEWMDEIQHGYGEEYMNDNSCYKGDWY